MNEKKEDEGHDFSEYARAVRTQEPPRPRFGDTTGGRILRGCGIAIGIAFLVLLFGVGACFMALG
jgi:hypothetical protein